MSERHTYPSKYPPGTHWSVTVAWEILDTLPPGRLDETERAYLSGLISGALVRAAKDGPIASDVLSKLPRLKTQKKMRLRDSGEP